MDDRLRELVRRAVGGDAEAAYRYYVLSSKSRVPREEMRGRPRDVVNLEARNFNGPLEIVVISDTWIVVEPVQEENQYGRTVVPVHINNVPYRIRSNFHYYPDAEPWNWIPYDPEMVGQTKIRFEALRGAGAHWNRWQDALIIGDDDLSINRIPGRDSGTSSAFRIAREILPRVVTAWANQNLEMLQTGGLIDVNNDILGVETALNEVEEQAAVLRQRLGELIIDELRLGGQEF